ncbi:MAG: protein kinase [Candidatus Acidiferrales bacterium]
MIGQTVSHYRILEKLGGGGMGVVYKAEDTRLHRAVGLKFLPTEMVHDAAALERFRREAQAASALNHSNICTIYDIGEQDGQQFIAMEFLDGATLKHKISGKPLPFDEMLEVAIQMADALRAAHAEGIIHRDIKPANIFVTKHGNAKVLDFGLAKFAPAAEGGVSPMPTATEDFLLTSPGSAVGTIAYMSPEQARGEELDARTDLFSFGAVLYEMATGKMAFPGKTTAVIHEAILNRAPVPVARLKPELPPKLEEIVNKALEKDRKLRYQSAADIRTDLQRLKRDTESGRAAVATAEPGSKAARKSTWTRWAAITGATVLAIGTILLLRHDVASKRAGRPEWVQLTSLPDAVNQPALSSDGRMIAFIRGPNTFIGAGEVYVKMLPSGEPAQLTQDGSRKMSPMFSPDGSRVAYTVLGPRNTWDTWIVSVLGGKPRLWMPNAAALTWLDNEQLLFSEIKQGQHMAIVTSTESRADSRDVYVPVGENAMAHRSYVSPDRKWILVVEMDGRGNWMPCRVVPMDRSSNGRAVGPPRAPCTSAAWSPDGRWMYLTADAGDNYHIWRQSFPDGEPQQLTSGPTEEEGIAVTLDGKSLITAVGLRQRPIWFHDTSGDHQISLEGYAFWPRLYLAGRKVGYRTGTWRSRFDTKNEIWLTDLDSRSNERLVHGFRVNTYHLSQDGRLVFSAFDAENKVRLWLARLDRRSSPHQIPSVEGDWPVFGRSGEVFFVSEEGNNNFLSVVHEDGTGLAKVSSEPMSEIHAISPDGKWVAGMGEKAGEVGSFEFAYPTGGGPRVPLCNPPSRMGWAPDGRYIYFSIPTGWMNLGGSGRTYILPTRPGTMFPAIPPGGFQSPDQITNAPHVRVIEAADIDLGPTPDVYAFSREVIQRNLYRIPSR